MIELELKYSVETWPKLSLEFEKGATNNVVDIYYDNENYDFVHKGIFIRTRGKRVDIKYLISEKEHSVCNEFNVLLSEFNKNNKELVEILKQLGLVIYGDSFEEFLSDNGLILLLKIDKNRTKYLKNDITVCFDDVVGLGLFVEIESTFKQMDNVNDAREKFTDVINNEVKFIGNYQEELTGYVELYLKKYNYKAYERCLFKG